MDAATITQKIAELLCSRENGYSVEVKDSVVSDRFYIGVDNARTGEHYIVQVDKLQ